MDRAGSTWEMVAVDIKVYVKNPEANELLGKPAC
jgi:hypothetical protein